MSETPTRVGEILYGDHNRDAIHVAVAPVTSAGGYLRPGARLKFLHADDTNLVIEAKREEDYIGVVDPFLQLPQWETIKVGQKFWMFLKPGSITSLAHEWTHPAFEAAKAVKVNDDPRVKAEKAIREFLASIDGPTFNEFMKTAKLDGKPYMTYTDEEANFPNDFDEYGSMYTDEEYFRTIGSDSCGEIPSSIWDHVELLLGIKLVNRPRYFSCTC